DRRKGPRRQSIIDRRATSRTLRKAQAFIDLEDLAEELSEIDPAAPGAQPGHDPATGLERRRGPGRRRSDFTKAAEEGEMTREQFLFVMAIDAFKRSNNVSFPTWTDVLEVLRLLGYRKTLPSSLNLPSAEDWVERPDAPAGVRQGATHLTRGDDPETRAACARPDPAKEKPPAHVRGRSSHPGNPRPQQPANQQSRYISRSKTSTPAASSMSAAGLAANHR